MIGVLHRISRTACLPCDRPWIDALFAEADALDPGASRPGWLLGAALVLVRGYVMHMAAALTPATIALLLAAISFTVLGLIEYEGVLAEDDQYLLLSLASLLGLLTVAVNNIRRQAMPMRS